MEVRGLILLAKLISATLSGVLLVSCTNPLGGGSLGSQIDPEFRPGLPGASFPDTLEIYSGDAQTAVAGNPITVSVRALDVNGVGVPSVTLSLRASAAGVVPATVKTDASGVATVTWILGGASGYQSLTVSGTSFTGSPSIVALRATALPGNVSSTRSSITGNGPTVANGTSSSTISITLKDSSNNPVPGVVPTFSATNTGNTNVYGACTSSNASGVSMCSLKSTKAEVKTLSLLTPTTKTGGTVTFTNGPATNLVFTTQPTGGVAESVLLPTQPVVELRDAFGNVCNTGADASANVTLSLSSGSGNLLGTLTRAAASGVATFSGLSIDTQGSGKVLSAEKASTTASGVVSQTSSSFIIDPPIPGSFAISSAVAGDSSVVLTWGAASNAASYTVVYGTTSGSYPTVVSTNAVSPLTITSLTPGATYYFMVRAVNITGTTSASAEATAVPLSSFSLSAPTVATGGVIRIPFGSSAGATSYSVKYGNSSGSHGTTASSNATSPHDVAGLVGGQTYYFMVTALNSSGSLNATSEVSATAIETFLMTSATAGTGEVTVVWPSVAGATSYDILYDTRSKVGGGTYTSVMTGVSSGTTVTGLAATIPWYFRIRANNANGSVLSTNELSATPLSSVSVTFNGWLGIKAVGRKTPAAQASDMSVAAAAVTLSWPVMTLSSGTVSSYNVYRGTTSGGQDLLSPIATGISSASRSYSDASVSGGVTYYYVVAPVVSGAVIFPSSTADLEIKITVPPDNMVLLHRWAANKEICEQMGKTPDRTENYRCTVATGATAPPGTGNSGYVDLEKSLLVDTFEQGCNYTYSTMESKCGSVNGCIGVVPPNSVIANSGDVYYNRASGSCYLNVSSGMGAVWVSAESALASQRQLMGSNSPGLPPFVVINQAKSRDVCSGQTLTGFSGSKRLLKRREYFLVSAWDSNIDDASAETLENGINLHSTNHCNTNYASPQGNSELSIAGTAPSLAYDNLGLPAAKETLPGCLNGNCVSTAASIRSLRTGSSSTGQCTSRYGAQDLVGNVWEWTSDRVACSLGICSGVAAASNAVDSTNDDFNGLMFDSVQGPNSGGTFTSFGQVQYPIGIPIADPSFMGDGLIAQTAAQLRGDFFWINPATTLGALSGGSWSTGGFSGRFALSLQSAPTYTSSSVGFRCAIPAE